MAAGGTRRWARIGAAAGLLAALARSTGIAEAAAPVFGAAAPLTTDAATDTGNDTSPRIATDGQGTWITIWAATDGIGGSLGSDSDVLVARSHDFGITWTAPLPVNSTATGDTEFDFAPVLATDGQGLWVAVWVATNGPDTDLFVARSTDAGASWTAEEPLYADAARMLPTTTIRRSPPTGMGRGSWCGTRTDAPEAIATSSSRARTTAA